MLEHNLCCIMFPFAVIGLWYVINELVNYMKGI